SWLAIATPSEYDYLVAKYFEISACNTVVVGNMANSGRHIWNDNFIEINEKMSDIEIIETIKKALNDKKMIKDKAKIMYELIQTEYNMIKYAEKIKKILNKI
ncbi:MAG: glycosyltransferase, partial [Romboutsia sp.]|nr:glycosyltransferase [Romboutsia sp.]